MHASLISMPGMRAARILAALAVLLALAIGIHTRFLSDAWPEHERVANDLAAVERTNAALTVETQQLQRDIEALRTRPAVQERVVRHELGVVRPGEGIVHLAKD